MTFHANCLLKILKNCQDIYSLKFLQHGSSAAVLILCLVWKIRHDILCKLFAEDSQELSSHIFLEIFTACVVCCSLDLMFGLIFMFHLC